MSFDNVMVQDHGEYMKKFLILAFALTVSPFAFADEEADDMSVDAEQIVIDAAADEGAAQDAKQLATNAAEEARQTKRKALDAKKQALSQELVAKRELERAEAKHIAAQEKVKQWRTELAIWNKKRLAFEDQTAKAKASQQVTEEKIKAAKLAVTEAHEAAEQARRARDEAQRIQAESEAEMHRLNKEMKVAQAEEAAAKAPIASTRAESARTPSNSWTALPRDCNLREQANAGAESLGPVLKGARVQAKQAGDKWYRVSTDNGRAGYMAAFCFKQ
jgi:hypothetical protein